MKVGIIGSGNIGKTVYSDIKSVEVVPTIYDVDVEATMVIKNTVIDLESNIKPILTEKQRKKFARQECKKGWKR